MPKEKLIQTFYLYFVMRAVAPKHGPHTPRRRKGYTVVGGTVMAVAGTLAVGDTDTTALAA